MASELLYQTKLNIEKLGVEVGVDPHPEAQYLLESIKSWSDLYHFLNLQLQIDLWDSEELFEFTITLVTGNYLPYLSRENLSDGYRKAVANVTDRNCGEV